MKAWSKKRKIFLGLLFLILVVQAVQPRKNDGKPFGPRDISSVVGVPDSVNVLLQKACYDCHSDYTVYPWYGHITPVNWWLADHVEEGKRELNFTHFGEYTPREIRGKLEGTAELIEEGKMPLHSYLWMHEDAKLSPAQRRAVAAWARAAQQKITE